MKYENGQQVWVAKFDNCSKQVICPDCGGTGRLRVTFHDETQVSIECRNCAGGYEPPKGYVTIYEWTPSALLTTITGCEIDGTKVEWRTAFSYRIPEAEIFDNEADAMAFALSKATAHNEAEAKRMLGKEKDTRTWAWNATYHRREMKEAQRRLEYHTAKLNVAALKANEDRRAKSSNP